MAISRFILTADVSPRSADAVEPALLKLAEQFNARLTRTDYEPAEAVGMMRQTGRRTVRKMGRA